MVNLDQFYTKDEVVEKCLGILQVVLILIGLLVFAEIIVDCISSKT